MGERFSIRKDSARIDGNNLIIQFFCRCGRYSDVSFSARELMNGKTYRCTTCNKTLTLKGLNWDRRVREL